MIFKFYKFVNGLLFPAFSRDGSSWGGTDKILIIIVKNQDSQPPHLVQRIFKSHWHHSFPFTKLWSTWWIKQETWCYSLVNKYTRVLPPKLCLFALRCKETMTMSHGQCLNLWQFALTVFVILGWGYFFLWPQSYFANFVFVFQITKVFGDWKNITFLPLFPLAKRRDLCIGLII